MKKLLIAAALLCFVLMLFSCQPEAAPATVYPADPYDGYVLFKNSDYQEFLRDATTLVIMRKGPSSTDWEYCIYVGNATSTVKTLKDIPDLIDYYVNPGTSYRYRLKFSNQNGVFKDIQTDPVTARQGFGELAVSIGEASFNGTSGLLSFSQRPAATIRKLAFPFNYRLEYNFRNGNVGFTVDLYQKNSINLFDFINDDPNTSMYLNNEYTLDTVTFEAYIVSDGLEYDYSKRLEISETSTAIPHITVPATLP